MVLGGYEKVEALLRRHSRAQVDTDIRRPGEFHIVLQGVGVGGTLSDHPLAIDGDPDHFRWVHLLLLAPEPDRCDVSLAVSRNRFSKVGRGTWSDDSMIMSSLSCRAGPTAALRVDP